MGHSTGKRRKGSISSRRNSCHQTCQVSEGIKRLRFLLGPIPIQKPDGNEGRMEVGEQTNLRVSLHGLLDLYRSIDNVQVVGAVIQVDRVLDFNQRVCDDIELRDNA